MSATALLAAIGDATQFTNGRQLAAWLGLVPREHSRGGTPQLLGISTRGHSYLGKWCVLGARATLRWIGTNNDERSQWLRALIARRGKNCAAVALANKKARIVWRSWRTTKRITHGPVPRSMKTGCKPEVFYLMSGAHEH